MSWAFKIAVDFWGHSVSCLLSGSFLSDVTHKAKGSTTGHLKKSHAQQKWKHWDKQLCVIYNPEIHNARDPGL